MPMPVALQLYTVREALANDFAGVVQRVADIGYVGVETAGLSSALEELAANVSRLAKVHCELVCPESVRVTNPDRDRGPAEEGAIISIP